MGFSDYQIEGDWEKDGFFYIRNVQPLSLLTGWHSFPKKVFEIVGINKPVLMSNQPALLVQRPFDSSRMFPAHQDSPYNKESKCTIWTPMTAEHNPSTHGSLYVGVGSHRLGELPHSDYSDVKANRLNEHPPLLRMDIAWGTAIVMHPHLIHASTLNEADSNKVSLQWRFADAEECPDNIDEEGNWMRISSGYGI